MLFLLSPAKSLDYDTPVAPALLERATKPQFMARSAELIDVLKRKTPTQVAALMDLSDALAQLNTKRYAAWSRRITAKNSKPALLAFDGDVYGGLQATSLNGDDIAWAQDHVVILSGLYGALRPLDLMQPYRLEMGTRLATLSATDLYGYWRDTLAEHLNRRSAADASPVIVNLASQEYFRAADSKALKARVVECVFEDWKGGRYKIISFFAKRARGLMARYAITHRLATPRQLEAFNLEGYAFAPEASRPERLVFRRRVG
jgi:uncharacterized protein